MPSKKKKYNARFPAGRIKKIMQTDEEVGKVAQAVPVIISRTLELFVESLLKKSMQITLARNAKTLTPSHMKQCILSESRFDFLKDLVKNIPDASVQEDNENNAMFEESLRVKEEKEPEAETSVKESLKMKIESGSAGHLRKRQATLSTPGAPSYHPEQGTSTGRIPVVQYVAPEPSKLNFSVSNLLGQQKQNKNEPKIHITVASGQLTPTNLATSSTSRAPSTVTSRVVINDNVPPLVPLTHTSGHSSSDSLTIDEDYDN